jgi:hypothetical protein
MEVGCWGYVRPHICVIRRVFFLHGAPLHACRGHVPSEYLVLPLQCRSCDEASLAFWSITCYFFYRHQCAFDPAFPAFPHSLPSDPTEQSSTYTHWNNGEPNNAGGIIPTFCISKIVSAYVMLYQCVCVCVREREREMSS